MITPLEMRDLARCFLACEAVSGKTSEPAESALLRVYEKLRLSLGAFAGVDGFQLLAFRALIQAKSESPSLWAVQLEADGSVQGLGEFKPQGVEFEPQLGSDKDQASEGGVIFIARLLSLLLMLLGKATTLSLLRDAWPGATFDDCVAGNGRES